MASLARLSHGRSSACTKTLASEEQTQGQAHQQLGRSRSSVARCSPSVALSSRKQDEEVDLGTPAASWTSLMNPTFLAKLFVSKLTALSSSSSSSSVEAPPASGDASKSDSNVAVSRSASSSSSEESKISGLSAVSSWITSPCSISSCTGILEGDNTMSSHYGTEERNGRFSIHPSLAPSPFPPSPSSFLQQNSRSRAAGTERRQPTGLLAGASFLLSLLTWPPRFCAACALSALSTALAFLTFPLRLLRAYFQQKQLWSQVDELSMQLAEVAYGHQVLENEAVALQRRHTHDQQRLLVLKQQRRGLMDAALVAMQQVNTLRERVQVLEAQLAAAQKLLLQSGSEGQGDAAVPANGSAQYARPGMAPHLTHAPPTSMALHHPQSPGQDARMPLSDAFPCHKMLRAACKGSALVFGVALLQVALLYLDKTAPPSSLNHWSLWLLACTAAFNWARFSLLVLGNRLFSAPSPGGAGRSCTATALRGPSAWFWWSVGAESGMWLLLLTCVALGCQLPHMLSLLRDLAGSSVPPQQQFDRQ